MKATQQSGFTLYELMTTLIVVGVLMAIGVPNVMEMQRNTAITSAANEIITGILAARAEAVKRQVPVVLCASPNPTAANPTCSANGAGANGGFIVWADENGNFDANGAPNLGDATDGNAVVDVGEALLIQRPAPGGTINVFADSGYIAYGPNGFRRNVPATGLPSAGWILLCDDRGNRLAAGQLSTARSVRIDATGRGLVQQTVADSTNALNQIRMTPPGAGAACP
jgi:prepilin-type N-terminal cleavage/methylation domain-containing protein